MLMDRLSLGEASAAALAERSAREELEGIATSAEAPEDLERSRGRQRAKIADQIRTSRISCAMHALQTVTCIAD